MRSVKIDKFLFVIFLLPAVLLTVVQPINSFAEMSVDTYCQLTIQNIQQQITQFHELVNLANQYAGKPETLAQQEKIKQAEFEKAREALFKLYGTTGKEYVLYMGKYKQVVDLYLKHNPDIKQQIDEAAIQRNGLLDKYESAKSQKR